MIIKVIGIQEQDYKLENGYAFKGKKIHAADMSTKGEGLSGHLVLNMKISADDILGKLPIEVGKMYTVYFDQKGRLDYLADYDPGK